MVPSPVHPGARRARPTPRLAALLAVTAAAAACATTSELDDPGSGDDPLSAPPAPVEQAGPVSIGYYLSSLNNSIELWNDLKLNTRSEEDLRKLRRLEPNISRRVELRLDELIEELESGPPRNRTIAAMALGFGESDQVLSPLLMALTDPEEDVVGNALVGLGYLASPDTPLVELCFHLRSNPAPRLRNNAAYALRRIAEQGGRDDCLLETARGALHDESEGVRTQALLILGLLGDGESVDTVGDLLYDASGLVCRAAGAALRSISEAELSTKGPAARALVTAYERLPDERARLLRTEMVLMRGTDLGDDVQPWKDWAYKLP